MKRVFSLILALTLLLSACAGSNPTDTTSSGPSAEPTAPSGETTAPTEASTAPGEESTVPTLPSQGTVQTHTLCGLTFTLDGTFEQITDQPDYATYHSDKISVEVSFGSMAELGEEICTSEALAGYFYDKAASAMGEDFEEILQSEQGGVSYVLMRGGEIVRTLVYGFYVCGDVGWTVAVNGYEPDLDEQSMIDMATGGVIDEEAIPELPLPEDPGPDTQPPTENEETDPFVPELPEPGNVIAFRGLTLNLDTLAEPTDVSETMLCFTCDGRRYDITYGTMEELPAPAADSGVLAWQLQEVYLAMWEQVSVERRNDINYVSCRDEDDFSAAVACYVSGDRWWTISTMGYMEITDQVLDLLTGAVTE